MRVGGRCSALVRLLLPLLPLAQGCDAGGESGGERCATTPWLFYSSYDKVVCSEAHFGPGGVADLDDYEACLDLRAATNGPVCEDFDWDAFDPCVAESCLDAAGRYGTADELAVNACAGMYWIECCGELCEG